MHTAKIFMTGNSQAVRLPKEFRLPGEKAIVSRLGDAIVLQPIKQSWKDIYHSMVKTNDFMLEREDVPPEEREKL